MKTISLLFTLIFLFTAHSQNLKALHFDGVDDLANISNYPKIESINDFTLQFFINFDRESTEFDEVIFDAYLSEEKTGLLLSRNADNQIELKINSNNLKFEEQDIIGQCIDLTLTCTDGLVKLYINSDLREEQQIDPEIINLDKRFISIGAKTNNDNSSNYLFVQDLYSSNYFNGTIDEIRFWKEALEEEQINSLSFMPVAIDYFHSKELEGVWSFDLDMDDSYLSFGLGKYNNRNIFLGAISDIDLSVSITRPNRVGKLCFEEIYSEEVYYNQENLKSSVINCGRSMSLEFVALYNSPCGLFAKFFYKDLHGSNICMRREVAPLPNGVYNIQNGGMPNSCGLPYFNQLSSLNTNLNYFCSNNGAGLSAPNMGIRIDPTSICFTPEICIRLYFDPCNTQLPLNQACHPSSFTPTPGCTFMEVCETLPIFNNISIDPGFQTDIVCNGLTITPNSTQGLHSWDFDDGTIINIINPSTHYYSNSGTYNVKHTIDYNGCILEETVIIEILDCNIAGQDICLVKPYTGLYIPLSTCPSVRPPLGPPNYGIGGCIEWIDLNNDGLYDNNNGEIINVEPYYLSTPTNTPAGVVWSKTPNPNWNPQIQNISTEFHYHMNDAVVYGMGTNPLPNYTYEWSFVSFNSPLNGVTIPYLVLNLNPISFIDNIYNPNSNIVFPTENSDFFNTGYTHFEMHGYYTYRLTATNSQGNTITDDITIFLGGECGVTASKTENTEAINEPSLNINSHFNIYPNPTKGVISIININNKSYNITVFNLNGQVVFKKDNLNSKEEKINLSNVSKGVYFMKLDNFENSQIEKIIIE